MNKTNFDALRSELLKLADETLNTKRRAYANDEDVLANFKEMANQAKLNPVKVWEVMMLKALNAMVRTAEGIDLGGESRPERFVDFLNYVVLGWALAQESTKPPSKLGDYYQRRPFLHNVIEPRLIEVNTITGKAANRVVD